VAPHEAKRALFEPRRVATPDGYLSTKCVAAGLFALLTQARLAAEDGEVLPTEITGSTFCYRVLEHGVPIYFVASSGMFWGFFIERDRGLIHQGGRIYPS
jgi:hypothetical protein